MIAQIFDSIGLGMTTVIISNIGLAIMMLVVYGRYSALKITSGKQIRDLYSREAELCKRLDESAQEKKTLEDQMLEKIHLGDVGNAAKTSGKRSMEDLLLEIDELRKEKESEIKARLEAEKQIELALQRTEEIQKRMDDWRLIQESAIKDSKDAIAKIGDEIYKKISDSYHEEVEANKSLIGKVNQNVAQYFDKFFGGGKNKNETPSSVAPKKTDANHHSEEHHHHKINVADPTKKIVNDLVSTFKICGFVAKKTCFIPSDLDPQTTKLMLCETAFIKDKKLYLLDLKSCRYFDEYRALAKDDKKYAADFLTQKIERYVGYISNQKYHNSVSKALSAFKSEYESDAITFLVKSKDDIKILQELNLLDKIKANKSFSLMDIDEINNMLL